MRKSRQLFWLALCVFVIGALAGAARLRKSLFEPIAMGSGPLAMSALLAGAGGAVLSGWTAEQMHRDGLFRNQVVCGHTRAEIFWADYLSNSSGALVLLAAFVTPLVFLESFRAAWPEDLPQALLACASTACIVFAFTSLYSLISAATGAGVACLIAYCILSS